MNELLNECCWNIYAASFVSLTSLASSFLSLTNVIFSTVPECRKAAPHSVCIVIWMNGPISACLSRKPMTPAHAAVQSARGTVVCPAFLNWAPTVRLTPILDYYEVRWLSTSDSSNYFNAFRLLWFLKTNMYLISDWGSGRCCMISEKCFWSEEVLHCWLSSSLASYVS